MNARNLSGKKDFAHGDLWDVEGRMDYNSQKPLVELPSTFMLYYPEASREL